jgi:hypothetical protein
MPADKFSFAPTPAQRTFAELVLTFSQRSDYLCSRIGETKVPTRRPMVPNGPKDTVVARLRESIQFCTSVFSGLGDTKLADSVVARMVPDGPVPRRTRAAVIVLTMGYWADAYGQLSQYVRLNGRIPPIPCRAPSGEGNCDNSINRCVETARGVPGSTFTLSDAPYSVTSDGRGPYRRAAANVSVVYLGWAAVLNLSAVRFDSTPPRSIKVDLNHPVPGDAGVPLGVVSADQGVEVGAQWYTEADYTAHSVLEIPIGSTVTAAQTDVEFHLNGVSHSLQMGPQPGGHCFSDGTAVDGTGTSRGTITRRDSTTWVVDLPPGSIGRLFDIHLSSPHAVNKGLYYVSLHFVLQR